MNFIFSGTQQESKVSIRFIIFNQIWFIGAVIASFIEPVYIKSFVIRGQFNRAAMEAVFSSRIPPIQHLPPGYLLNVPILECDDQVSTYFVNLTKSFVQIHPAFELGVNNYTPGDRPAIVWNAVNEEFEMLSCSSGFSING